MANLILWRHAEAEAQSTSGADIDRALTKRGHKDAAIMAKWLSQHLPADAEILCSPALRCLQTVDELKSLNNFEVKVADFLSVDHSVEIIAKQVTNNDVNKTILIIGHQPNLGLLIGKLLGMHDRACVVKKGAVWWLRQRFTNDANGIPQTYLFMVQHPDF
ncbi:MAG: histidine phosphatase family protein [Methylotenera sp.]